MALSWNLSEGTNKKQKTPQSGYSETWPKFERDTPEYKEVTGNAIWANLPGEQSRKSATLC
jgi:hypothetical protein